MVLVGPAPHLLCCGGACCALGCLGFGLVHAVHRYKLVVTRGPIYRRMHHHPGMRRQAGRRGRVRTQPRVWHSTHLIGWRKARFLYVPCVDRTRSLLPPCMPMHAHRAPHCCATYPHHVCCCAECGFAAVRLHTVAVSARSAKNSFLHTSRRRPAPGEAITSWFS